MTWVLAMVLASEPVELSAAETKQAVESFKVRGAWIHPAIVQEFERSSSQRGRASTAVGSRIAR